MNRLLYLANRMLSTLRHWAVRRFTPAGWLVLIGLAITAGMGTDTEQAMAYQAFALLLCLLVVALVCAPFFRGRFSIRRELPRFGSVGERVHYRVLLRNYTDKIQAGLALIENLADPRPSYQEFLASIERRREYRSFRLAKSRPRPTGSKATTDPRKENASRPKPTRRVAALKDQPLPALLPKSETEVRMELTPLRRGALHFTGTTVARPDPFGLFRAMLTVPCPQTLLVLPKRYLLPPIALPGTMKYHQGGVALASAVGQSDEFVALRDYRHGDPLRHVHWKSWARTGRPIVKEFQDEFFVRHALILDTFIEPDDGEAFEEAVSVAASFACAIQSQESLLDLMFVGTEAYCFTAGRGLAHTDQMLEILASVRVCREKPFRALRELVIGHAGSVSGCICVLLSWDEERQKLVRQLRAAGLPVLALVVTSNPGPAPLDPGPMGDEPEKLKQLAAGRIEEGLAELS